TPDPTVARRPATRLGPRYVVVYLVPGPNDIQSHVVQYVYPYAKPTPVTYMKPGQRFWGARQAHGGWYRAGPALKRVLVRAGLPATAPSSAPERARSARGPAPRADRALARDPPDRRPGCGLGLADSRPGGCAYGAARHRTGTARGHDRARGGDVPGWESRARGEA